MKSKTNWFLHMQKALDSFEGRPKVLLHSCCAPCSSYVIDYLQKFCDVTVYYYNPNIYPEQEYIKRKNEQLRLLEILGVGQIDADYLPEDFYRAARGLEGEKEGGKRCERCFHLRLSVTAQAALEGGFDMFCTTLTVSPHKNAELINNIAQEIGDNIGIMPLPADFKKNNGYQKSISLSKEYQLYRQEYCGCEFSLR